MQTSKHVGVNVEGDLERALFVSYLCTANRWSNERHQVHLNVRVAKEEDENKDWRQKQIIHIFKT